MKKMIIIILFVAELSSWATRSYMICTAEPDTSCRITLEADRVKIENEIKGLSTPIATNVDQVAFIKSASEFLLMHKINSGEFVDYKELATLDEESLKQFMNSVIDHIVVRERKIVEIVFTNGLSHTLLYK